jgi:predicted DNA-binding ribbon-helix-helix protein
LAVADARDPRGWQCLREIALRRRMTMADLVGEIAAQRQQSNLSSALRLYVLEFYRSQINGGADGEGVAG